MFPKTLKATAEKLVQYCREDKTAEGLKTLYHRDAVSAEAMAMPGADSAESKGLKAIKAKHDWWYANHDVHSQNVEGPFYHGPDRFGVIFEIDVTNKQSGQRMAMRELAVYTVNPKGKIVREEFFYNA
ncbi:MAG: nuclear transport factor 2 family protein [Rhodomicrobium sp.]|nr:nuclear transport factor 2 family protein [Rhodomicrobium sp.]